MADFATALWSELRQGETEEKKHGFADDTGSNYWLLSGVNTKFKEGTDNINNNNIWGESTSAFKTTQAGTLSSTLRESDRHCKDLDDVKFLTESTQMPYPMRPENEVTPRGLRIENCHLDTNGVNSVETKPEESVNKSLAVKTVCGGGYQATDGVEIEPEKVKDGIELTADDQYEPLSVKERIRNIDLSIEWIKSELSLMRAQSLSLMEQYEELFGEIMDLKLRIEMQKEDKEPQLESRFFEKLGNFCSVP